MAAEMPLAGPQPPAKIVVDPPLAEPLSRGVVFIQYRTENLDVVPVFGPHSNAQQTRWSSSASLRRGVWYAA
jgi:hypothetical protein